LDLSQKAALREARSIFAWVLLVVMFVGPFIRINGNPLLMFNIPARKFAIFGQMFWPQDLNIFAVIMVIAFIMITLFTAVFGRLWCGWACPQTVLMEMVFRKIEYWIEGDGPKQRALARMPWNAEKIRKKTVKLTIFFALSFIISNWLLMYVIGSDTWIRIVTDNPLNHLKGLTAMIIFTLIFFAIFARFREQACTFICPYGRFQSVMIDENSLVVAYDHVRGENRGKKAHGSQMSERRTVGLGDCVDCNACVAVCPTGIDIRNGIQMECVNCTHCIDACNAVMDKLSLPSGLVRYASLNALKEKRSFRFTSRLAGYCAILTILGGLLVYLLGTHQNVEVSMLRAQGSIYQQQPDGFLSNLFTIKLLNKTNAPVEVRLVLEEQSGEIQVIGTQLVAEGQSITKAAAFVKLPADAIRGGKIPLHISVYQEDRKIQTVKTQFIGPGGSL
jgi:cytochrome c oxidase accessory protein FixG